METLNWQSGVNAFVWVCISADTQSIHALSAVAFGLVFCFFLLYNIVLLSHYQQFNIDR